ncbi:asparagine synthetase domain-containing protein 1-like isoform X1 [Clavelina lepadiformis]|uniref:asparagine synthetase domain-containing protein 1-like isoform X1 n=3 Tax=Clavelina lepadiformis TaxID=159417 RepID=UPI00404165C7
MCGIFCSVACTSKVERSYETLHNLENSLKRRGPDQHDKIEIEFDGQHLLLASWVLHMRGSEFVPQPARSSSGNVLLWNGELYAGFKVPKGVSDTEVVVQQLEIQSNETSVESIMSLMRGPWAFVYFQKTTKKLWFGRDYFGRRSLLLSYSQKNLIISSVANRTFSEWIEIPPGVFCIDLNVIEDDIFSALTAFPWISVTDKKPKISWDSKINLFANISSSINPPIPVCSEQKHRFRGNDASTDRRSSDVEAKPIEILVENCEKKQLWPYCQALINKLRNAVEHRTQTLESWGNNCKVGILFSGGIDCTVLALLAHSVIQISEPIELLNVAFESPKKKPQGKKSMQNNATKEVDYNVPDRITGRNSYEELRNLCPNRTWKFVEINVTIKELQHQRSQHIGDLTYPKATVLDDSIACALWFACRGETSGSPLGGAKDQYIASSRILLCGMGADEQLGGYSRHRGIFEKKHDWAEVQAEMDMEIERIAERNLGRDDRILADHAREGLFPYLDEEVVGFLSSLPTHLKADFHLPRGVGEKILLRGAAYILGLRGTAVFPKRAIQFGSRIAKAESGREKGNDICTRLNRK